MRIQEQLHYDGTVDDVVAMVTDASFQRQVADRMHAVRSSLEVSHTDDGGFTATISRSLPGMVPDFLKPLVGREIEVVQQETWSAPDVAGGRTGTLVVTSPGKPLSFTGATTLVPTEDACAQTVDGDVKVRLLIGAGRIAEHVGRAVRSGMAVQHEEGNRWLAARTDAPE